MYRIIRIDGTELGITDHINFIKVSETGDFTLTTKDLATGVAYQSYPYNLMGHEAIEGADTVVISEFDGGETLTMQQAMTDELIMTVLGG